MKELHNMPVWAPSDAEMKAFNARIRAERAKAFRGAVRYVSRKVGSALTADRAADKVHLGDAKAS